MNVGTMVRALPHTLEARFGITWKMLLMWALIGVLLMVFSHSLAAGGGTTSTGFAAFDAQGQKACSWILGISTNVLVRVFFFGMAVIGFIMGLARARGGWVLCGIGALGAILVVQAVPLAKQIGIVPSECTNI
ncbi:hypothetical protein Dxin01_00770 [Deinococcus xinjiangensis]|uniref:TrbC/VIRB2 family protein n=1 Tax=Deinococcus xinjiangensis TaxID=457454 RepID=A0ABP9V703_9DEIO